MFRFKLGVLMKWRIAVTHNCCSVLPRRKLADADGRDTLSFNAIEDAKPFLQPVSAFGIIGCWVKERRLRRFAQRQQSEFLRRRPEDRFFDVELLRLREDEGRHTREAVMRSRADQNLDRQFQGLRVATQRRSLLPQLS